MTTTLSLSNESTTAVAPSAHHDPAVRRWMVTCTALFALLVLFGGIVRVTRSGLSIVEWAPVTGVLPPLGEGAWDRAYHAYLATPEARLVHVGISRAGFERLFWLEWGHRLIARIVGLVYVIPLISFAIRRRFERRTGLTVISVSVLLTGQAAVGWWMVKSGLVREPWVNPYRLAFHFAVGIALFGAMLATTASLSLGAARSDRVPVGRRERWLAPASLVAVYVTMIWGALTAGLRAGLACSTFPRMFGAWIPGSVIAAMSAPSGFVATGLVVQWTHRALAVALLALAIAGVADAHRQGATLTTRRLAWYFAVLVVVQGTLGAWLVLRFVPPAIAWVHQANGLLVFSVALVRAVRARQFESPRERALATHGG